MAFAFPPWADTAFRVGLIGFALAVLGVFVVPILLSTFVSDGAWVVGVGVLIFLVALLFGIIAPRVMYARKIDLNVARFGGCGEEFLDSLPQYLD